MQFRLTRAFREQGAMFEPASVAIHGVFQNDYHGGEYALNPRRRYSRNVHHAVD